MDSRMVERLADKSLTTEQLLKKVTEDFRLLPSVVNGMTSQRAAIRYGCGKVMMKLSEDYPERVYPHMDFFVQLLESTYRILTWQAMAIIANLTKVDTQNKFEVIFDTYYHLLHDEYMVTVANVVGHSGKIALAKPHLIPQITQRLLSVEHLKTTPHLTGACKQVIIDHTLTSLDMFFDNIPNKEPVLRFVKKQTKSPRKTVRVHAEEFLQKWNRDTQKRRRS
ncbi:MAG: hypothetical protein JXA00_00160 [Candidatus Thermoplasmatota archaeon]|nr:hypothetical protein [Candidatus Thermoplasmatota archaeon]